LNSLKPFVTVSEYHSKLHFKSITLILSPLQPERDALDMAKESVESILSQLRIRAQVIAVDGRAFEDESAPLFVALKRPEFERYGMGSIDALLPVERTLTTRFLNLGDQIRFRSGWEGSYKQVCVF
jgi:hypothetical protein